MKHKYDWTNKTVALVELVGKNSRGPVNIRWLGESNGCYSESVEIKWGKPVE